jgi:hypothetical protein
MALKIYDIVADFGALGDGINVTATFSIANGSTSLSCTTNQWVSGDVGKTITFFTGQIDGGSGLPLSFRSTIASFSDAKHVTLNNSYTFPTISGYTDQIEWGYDDTNAFDAFTTAALSWQSGHPGDTFQLLLPKQTPTPTIYSVLNNLGTNDYFARGLKNVTVTGQGVARGDVWISDQLTNFGIGGINLSCNGFTFPINQPGTGNYPSSLVQSVNAGDVSVTFLTPSELSRFSVGDTVMMGGLDLQGGGYPPNLQWVEFPIIANISSPTMTFTAPLKYNYRSTWPYWNPGTDHGPFAADNGGPAGVFPLVPAFQTITKHENYTLSQWCRQTSANGNNITLNIDARGPLGIICSSQNISSLNINQSDAQMEYDKCVGPSVMTGVSSNVAFQSPGTNNLTLNSFTGSLIGTPDNLIANSCTIPELRLGCYAYGASSSVTLNSCSAGISEVGGVQDFGGPSHIGVNNFYGMSGGIITSTAGSPVPWAVPGRLCFWWNSNGDTFGSFTILDTYLSAGTQYILTNWPGGWPTENPALLDSGNLALRMHICPSLTITPISAAWPTTAPYGSFWYSGDLTPTNIGFDGASNFTGAMWGKVTSIVIDVVSAYTGTQNPLVLKWPGVFDNYTVVDNTNRNTTFYAPNVNLRQAGRRVITPAGVTFNGVPGSGSGDTNLALPYAQSWFIHGSGFGASHDISGEPSSGLLLRITVNLDQGFIQGTSISTPILMGQSWT